MPDRNHREHVPCRIPRRVAYLDESQVTRTEDRDSGKPKSGVTKVKGWPEEHRSGGRYPSQ